MGGAESSVTCEDHLWRVVFGVLCNRMYLGDPLGIQREKGEVFLN